MLAHLYSLCTMEPREKELLRKMLLTNTFALVHCFLKKTISRAAQQNITNWGLKQERLTSLQPWWSEVSDPDTGEAGLCCGS